MTLTASNARTPAHDLDAEEAVLGSMLLSDTVVAAVVEILSPADFYKPSHGHLYTAIVSLFGRGQPVDAITVVDELRVLGLLEAFGDQSALVGLQINTPSIANGRHYAEIVSGHATLRRLQAAAGEITDIALSNPPDANLALDAAEEKIHAARSKRVVDPFVSIGEVALSTYDRIDAIDRGEDLDDRVGTGVVALDAFLGGLYRGALIICGGRPSMGKTSLATSIATHVSLVEKKPVCFFSLEMGEFEIKDRILSQLSGLSPKSIRDATLSPSERVRLDEAIALVQPAPLFLDRTPGVNVLDVRARSRIAASRHGQLGLIVVDYLQLLTSGRYQDNKVADTTEVSRSLKMLGRELNTPVLALSQLSRMLEHRSEKRPVLADLRESGSIEQDADVVLFPYRPAAYDDTVDPAESEIIVAKHRNGELGTVRLRWEGSRTQFGDVGVHL
jgi:replicative DNA helicase